MMPLAKQKKLTQKRLHEVLDYDQKTGFFTWKVSLTNSVPAGSRAHNVMPPRGYIRIGVDGEIFLAHRLAWFYVHGEWPDLLDHIDRNTSNNRLSNLRRATQSQNHQNQGLSKRNTSGVKGVSWDKARVKWKLHIAAGNKKKQIRFDTKEQAIAARKDAEDKYFGEFAAS